MSQGSGSVVFSRKTHFYCFLATKRFLYNSSQVKTDTYFFVFFHLNSINPDWSSLPGILSTILPSPLSRPQSQLGRKHFLGILGKCLLLEKKGGLCLTFGGKLEESRKSSFLEGASGRWEKPKGLRITPPNTTRARSC